MLLTSTLKVSLFWNSVVTRPPRWRVSSWSAPLTKYSIVPSIATFRTCLLRRGRGLNLADA